MVLEELNLSNVAKETNEDVIRHTISVLFWAWYSVNSDRKLFTLKKWIFSKTVYVRDLYEVFVLLFGPLKLA